MLWQQVEIITSWLGSKQYSSYCFFIIVAPIAVSSASIKPNSNKAFLKLSKETPW